jgi:hypothetical protein
MLQDVLQEDILEHVVLERPGRLLDVHQDIGLALRKAVGVDEAVPTIEAASQVQLGQKRSPSLIPATRRLALGRRRFRVLLAVRRRNLGEGSRPTPQNAQPRQGGSQEAQKLGQG